MSGRVTDAELAQLRSGPVLLTLAKQHVKGKWKQRGDEWWACCPFHDEDNPSFSVNTAKGVYSCKACPAKGDAIEFVMKKKGLDFLEACEFVADLNGIQLSKNQKGNGKAKPDEWVPIVPSADTPRPTPAELRHHKFGEPADLYEYVDTVGHPKFYIRRFEPKPGEKEIRPLSYGISKGKKGWHEKHYPPPRPLFRLDAITQAGERTILIVEGEKAAKAAERLFPDYVVTTWAGGANATSYSDFSPLNDGARVVLWPDADERGRAAMAEIAKQLPKAHILDVDDLSDGFDAADLEEDDPELWLRQRLRDLPPQMEPDGEEKPDGKGKTPEGDSIEPELWAWREPTTIPPRQWLVGRLLLRGYATLLASRGGTGKTALAIGIALSYVTGRPEIIGMQVFQPGHAWIITLEDDRLEIERRIAAAMLEHGIDHHDVEGRLFVNDATKRPLILAETDSRGERFIKAPDADKIRDAIQRRSIGLTVIDPLVKAHRVRENDNTHMDGLFTLANNLSRDTDAALMLLAHFRKGNGTAERDMVRGAGAQTDAARINRTLQALAPKEAEAWGINPKEAFRYLCLQDTKANLAPREDDDWIELVSVDLGNTEVDPRYPLGDSVQAARHWKPAPMFEGMDADTLQAVFTAIDAKPHSPSPQSRNLPWVGLPLKEVGKRNQKQTNNILSQWRKSKTLVDGPEVPAGNRSTKVKTVKLDPEKTAEILLSLNRTPPSEGEDGIA